MIYEVPAHVFRKEAISNGNRIRGLCFAKGPAPVLAVWSRTPGAPPVFDARELSGKRVMVRDASVVELLTVLFSSFERPIKLPEFVDSSGSVHAEADVVSELPSGVSLADFSKVSRRMFQLVIPELKFETRVVNSNVTGPRVTLLALDTVLFGWRGSDADPVVRERQRRVLNTRCDKDRLRELEWRFQVRLFDEAQEMARGADKAFAEKERKALATSEAVVAARGPVEPGKLVPANGRLMDPRDPVRGELRVESKELAPVAKSQGVSSVEPGTALSLQIGNEPARPWYVHEVGKTHTTLAPWMPVRLGRRVDYIGVSEEDDREIRAVTGEVQPLLQGEVSDRMLVGDVDKSVFGELHRTGNGQWAVKGAPNNGYPSHDKFVRDLAKKTRTGSGGRVDYACVGAPLAQNEKDCEASGGVWDRPCTRDHECQYFSSDGRGGCIDGWCEMPMGVTNVSYTTGEGTPVCHGCPVSGGDPLRCCEYQDPPRYAWP